MRWLSPVASSARLLHAPYRSCRACSSAAAQWMLLFRGAAPSPRRAPLCMQFSRRCASSSSRPAAAASLDDSDAAAAPPAAEAAEPEGAPSAGEGQEPSCSNGSIVPVVAALLVGSSAAGFFAGRLVGKEEPGAWDFEWDEAWRLSNASNLEQQQQKQRQNEQQQQQPTPYTRHLLLVRHAQFDNVESTDDEMQGLTPLGRLQAEVTGDRLKAILKEKKVAGVYHSNMRRARETAEIVIAKLGDAAPAVSAVQDPLLAEGVPAMPLPPSTVFHPTQATVDVDSKRIEEAFRRYFYRPPSPNQLASSSAGGSSSTSSSTSTSSSSGSNSSSKSSNEEYTILICHGNVIRYFFCRALQLPPNAWLRLATFNCGITWLTIDRRGYVSARQFGDVGHLSPSLITYR